MFRHRRQHHTYFGADEQRQRRLPEKFRHPDDPHRHSHEFLRHYRYFRYHRPIVLLFTLMLLYLLFSWVGFKGIGIFFAVLLITKEIVQFFFLLRLETRIFNPMKNVKQGLDEVAKGNYGIKIEYDKPNDLGFLISSFNEMTAKLSESEKLKAEYEENRKALIANISHDLKTPITAIQGYIEALLDGTATSAAHKASYLKTIHQNSIYVNKLIDDLFLFSKLDMQKLDFHYEDVSIRAFMSDLMEEYRFDLEERNIQVEYTVQAAADYCIKLDGKRFHQAFNNLISNAVQHGPETGLSIQVKLYRQNNFVCLDVKDNGPGIPEDKLPFIFDRFYRIETERPKGFASTGLGLAIAKELVEAQGGKITVSSIKNMGTCFTIMLPILPSKESESYQ
ncbi:Histidine kinase [uncultured Sporomusa sp.]|uniref:histidine kinase n=1 Tax=uncultured Sporomusa sp. TaxID=307249 RepID=A0A212LP59_9FIRM|nr:HAMP domain-containing sensor histidine kinase [uncultured Sporomusa sp.]SCM79229.1 Histidine kinase [uncultured Sporomusa sp.]